jgi:hypothetical protein
MPVIAAIGAVSAFSGFLGGILGGAEKRDAGYEASFLTDAQAKNQGLVLQEQLRRTELQDEQVLGTNTARANASGFQTTTGGEADKFQVTSTTQLYLKQLQAEQAKELAFQKSQGEASIELMHFGARVQRQAADAGMLGDVLGGLNAGLNGIQTMSRGLGWIK